MDLRIPHELQMIRKTVADFRDRHLTPLERKVDKEDGLSEELSAELRAKVVELGLYGYNAPADIGGPGLSVFEQTIIDEELGQTSLPLADVFGHLPGSLAFSDAKQKSWLVEPLLRGEKKITYALTEPDAGSDLGMVRTRATRNGSGWLLNGSKQFISNAEAADFVLTLAVTNPEASLKERFTTFIVEKGNPGLKGMSRMGKMAWHGHHLNSFSLEDCFVPDSHVLGAVGSGFLAMMTSVNNDRLYVSARCVGLASRAHSIAVSYANQRKTFGSLLGQHQAIQFMIADTETELEAARMLVYRAACLADASDPATRVAASQAKLFSTEMAGRAADRALQILGGAGFTTEWPIERLYRDARGFRLGEGTSEIQRLQIARHALSRGA